MTTNVSNQSDAAAIIDAVHKSADVKHVSVSRGSESSATAVAVPEGFKLESTKRFVDEFLQAPERVRGTSQHHTLNSFLSHVKEFTQAGRSSIFADIKSSTLRCIYDYHQTGKPSYNEHKAHFAAEASKQWKKWTGGNGDAMNQAEFANFIESNALDLIDAPDGSSAGDDAILNIAKTLNTTIASASKIIELARGISINEDSKAKSHFDPGSGQVQLEYVTEHRDGAGKRLTVPGLFLIAIPVFEGEHPYRIVVRLRYRLKEGAVSWIFQLYQPEKCVEDAFNGLCEQAEITTGLKVYRGTAES